MRRRDIIKYTALITGSAIVVPIVLPFTSCTSGDLDSSIAYIPRFFNESQFALVKDLIDVILPTTDSPSASEVGVHQIIDEMVSKTYTKEQIEDYQKGFFSLQEYLNQQSKTGSFTKMKEAEKLSILKMLESSKDNNINNIKEAYLVFKQQSVAYYLSTETIGTKFLNYLPLPGPYQACISLTDVGGKAWAL